MNPCSTVQLLDLPDEILIKIFNKLPTVDVFYSISGVNKRLDQLIHDPIFTRFLDLTIKVPYDERESLPDAMLNQFCSTILPEIHHNIQTLSLEPLSIERIFQKCHYPKLHKLILHSIKPEIFIQYCSNDSTIIHIFKQITHLDMFTIEYYNTTTDVDSSTTGYAHLFSICQNLTHLNVKAKYFHSTAMHFHYDLPLTMCSSSTLIELHINVRTFDDCLRLLDGRFNQMKSFHVTIDHIEEPLLNIDNQSILPNLTTFSLFLIFPTKEYDDLILPLLRRMPNIEKLILFLKVENRSEFILGDQLYNEIFIHMPRIKNFLFDITTMNSCVDLSYWLKNDDIEETYTIDDPHVYFCIDYFTNGVGRCRIAILPLLY